MAEILQMYRERNGDPTFWGEPFNALTNVSFLIAAAFALRLAMQRDAATPLTLLMILIAGTIGVGSFVFHTAAGPITKWLDIIPIALFMVMFFGLAFYRILQFNWLWSCTIVIGLLVISLMLLPVHKPLNGSLFYLPSWTAIAFLGVSTASSDRFQEPFLLLAATGCFTCAIAARTSDWVVPWGIGSHFLWHLINGIVVYLGLRSWIVEVAGKQHHVEK